MSDFEDLLVFLLNAGYSWPVHEEAIARLKASLPAEREKLRAMNARDRVAKVAESRLRRPGDLNQQIGKALLQVAQEIDNVLNRLLDGPGESSRGGRAA